MFFSANDPKSKHIHIIHCWVSEKEGDKKLKSIYVAAADNAADIYRIAAC